ncbi:MAG TPA: substrate-binding domain-containing protein [Gammaproteobacteria bacterium]|nr:substrate-binding domain-containing protein [Gammaproteobacteria bacterium]
MHLVDKLPGYGKRVGLITTAAAAALLCACGSPPAPDSGAVTAPEPSAVERPIKVITSGGFTAAFETLAPLFEQATGIEIETVHGSSMGGGPQSMPVRLSQGEAADLLIFNDQAYADLDAAGYLRPQTRVDLGESVIGMSVRSGAPKPDISTREAFIAALRDAESIGYSASVSGTYLSTVAFPALGIWEEIEPKTKRIMTERVASAVARGEVEIGFQAVSEILSIEGADFVGTIPEELQQVSTFLAVVAERAENPEGAARLIDFLSSQAAAGVIESTGLRPLRRSSRLSAASGSVSEAGEVKVITSGGFTAAFDVLGPIFAQATGVELATEYGSSMGGGPQSIAVRLERGETADILIMNRPPLDQLAAAGRVRPNARVDLGRSLIGMAVRSGAPKPDISTREALIATLLAAESIGYSASVSGTRLSNEIFPSLGIWEQIEPKSQRVFTERVAEVVARGEVEIGFQQVSAILPVEGADFAGLLPDELQEVAFFSAGIMAQAANPDNAQRLVAFLSSAAAAPIIEATGLTPVVAAWAP